MDKEVIIRAEGLGKKYALGQNGDAGPYRTLRETLSDQSKALLRRFRADRAASETAPTDEFWALRDINFEVRRGEVVGIIGRNGAGKSTLLKVLSRITEPTTGRITLKGRVASLLEVGTGFHPELTGRENIFLNGAILGMHRREIKAKFDEIVAFAEVERFLDTPVKRYSSGMYVRLAFAVAAHLEPEILIIDEVLAVGDAEFQKKCLGKMDDVAKREGRTVLFVSHNMAALKTLCRRAVIMTNGRLDSCATVDAATTRYLQNSRTQKSLQKCVNVTETLSLIKLDFDPNPMVSGQNTNYSITFQAAKDAKITELVILLYSLDGERLAILDLRETSIPPILKGGQAWRVTGRIIGIPLIEGDYRVGLFVAAGGFSGNILDLLELSISTRTHEFDYSPYPPEARGRMKLDFGGRWFQVLDEV